MAYYYKNIKHIKELDTVDLRKMSRKELNAVYTGVSKYAYQSYNRAVKKGIRTYAMGSLEHALMTEYNKASSYKRPKGEKLQPRTQKAKATKANPNPDTTYTYYHHVSAEDQLIHDINAFRKFIWTTTGPSAYARATGQGKKVKSMAEIEEEEVNEANRRLKPEEDVEYDENGTKIVHERPRLSSEQLSQFWGLYLEVYPTGKANDWTSEEIKEACYEEMTTNPNPKGGYDEWVANLEELFITHPHGSAEGIPTSAD